MEEEDGWMDVWIDLMFLFCFLEGGGRKIRIARQGGSERSEAESQSGYHGFSIVSCLRQT